MCPGVEFSSAFSPSFYNLIQKNNTYIYELFIFTVEGKEQDSW